ncbi:MAG: S26 family signal peptidase [Gammaproteobacteria bacterium]|nr:S26 family signal peptidase [Gammaproteobacteria bacterium]
MIVSSSIFGRRGLGEAPGHHDGGVTGGRQARIGMTVMVLLALLWLLAASRVHVNASWSDDAWGYFVLPMLQEPKPGDLVVFEPPVPDSGIPRIPYLKTILGTPGMHVSVDSGGIVTVGNTVAGEAKTNALDGRPLKPAEPVIIPPGHYYVHAGHVDSHDSRYAEIGLVHRERILGRAFPLPDLPWLGLAGPLVGPEDNVTTGAWKQ